MANRTTNRYMLIYGKKCEWQYIEFEADATTKSQMIEALAQQGTLHAVPEEYADKVQFAAMLAAESGDVALAIKAYEFQKANPMEA